MPPGLDALRRIVVLIMENRSFHHMLGSAPVIGGMADTGAYGNPEMTGTLANPQPLAACRAIATAENSSIA